jgi:accessory gene regulator B
MIKEGILFITTFALLRRYTGGYHAKTHLNCILGFSGILAGTMTMLHLASQVQIGNMPTLILATVAFIGIYICIPVDQSDTPLGSEGYKKTRKKGRWLSFVIWLTCVIDAYIINLDIGFTLSLSMLSVFGSMLCVLLYRYASVKEVIKND